MPGLLIGYARVSTDEQDLTVQREALQALGVAPERVYVDHGVTGTHRERSRAATGDGGLPPGDTLVVTKLDRPGQEAHLVKLYRRRARCLRRATLSRSSPNASQALARRVDFQHCASTVFRAIERSQVAASGALEPVRS